MGRETNKPDEHTGVNVSTRLEKSDQQAAVLNKAAIDQAVKQAIQDMPDSTGSPTVSAKELPRQQSDEEGAELPDEVPSPSNSSAQSSASENPRLPDEAVRQPSERGSPTEVNEAPSPSHLPASTVDEEFRAGRDVGSPGHGSEQTATPSSPGGAEAGSASVASGTESTRKTGEQADTGPREQQAGSGSSATAGGAQNMGEEGRQHGEQADAAPSEQQSAGGPSAKADKRQRYMEEANTSLQKLMRDHNINEKDLTERHKSELERLRDFHADKLGSKTGMTQKREDLYNKEANRIFGDIKERKRLANAYDRNQYGASSQYRSTGGLTSNSPSLAEAGIISASTNQQAPNIPRMSARERSERTAKQLDVQRGDALGYGNDGAISTRDGQKNIRPGRK